MGPLPEAGKWVRLSVPAKLVVVGLENHSILGWAYTLHGGSATWDCSGVLNPAINAWVEDEIPGSATSVGQWSWVTKPSHYPKSQYSGTTLHLSPVVQSLLQGDCLASCI
ncbi:MAG: hypothetical protein JW915_01790 [Chitinispirillaceae bacterium]|nr:hypothetical protein [Chitinispirillaceae bacterium]